MPTVDHLLYDVFTDTPFTGNPLAIAVDPPALSDAQMQTMAKELNLSETVFLTTGGADGVVTRIFTPAVELPFAGHPTIGAALALADLGLTSGPVTLLEQVGPIEVAVDDGFASLTTAGPPTSVDVADPEDVIRSLGLELSDLHSSLGVRGWSVGGPFTVLTVRDVETLGRCQVDLSWWRDTMAHTAAPDIYVLAPVDPGQRVDARAWRARMFAPALGIGEDPATGSAAAATCGYLAGHASPERLAEGWVIEQGVEMGRPSEIHVGAVLRGPELVAATVGGRAVRVGAGSMDL
ncbi:PhzF family phenazine biosynthesis protein [Actinospongicola halichondriae]|uniref:PhzF family phenazine biosynthesis protein n=1 Tax=Actinospongicola halichondriae TaxID=3236844 RepID=UPI003D548391